MAENILITGASGTVGKELLRSLEHKNVSIRIGVRDIKKIESLNLGNYKTVIFDYEKPETFVRAFEGIQRLFLTIPLGYLHVDNLIIPAINAAKRMGILQIITLGTMGVDIDGSSPLSVVEKCIVQSGIDYTILRPNLFMQNILYLSSIIKKEDKLPLPAGNASISFVDLRDAADAIANVIVDQSFKNQIFYLTGNECLTLYKIAQIISEISFRSITYKPVSHNEAYKKFIEIGLSEKSANLMNGLFEIAHQGWCKEIHPDLKRIIKRDPISFKQFAIDYKRYW